MSGIWIRIKAKHIFNEEKEANPARWASKDFKASCVWMCRFIEKRHIKFCKRKPKNGSQEFEHFMSTLRFNFLLPRDDGRAEQKDPL